MYLFLSIRQKTIKLKKKLTIKEAIVLLVIFWHLFYLQHIGAS